MVKVLICGGRDYKPSFRDIAKVAYLLSEYHIEEVVSGRCRGADKFGERVAQVLSLPINGFPADWETHGKAAGFIRNREMLEFLDEDDLVLALPGGKGTENMKNLAKEAGIEVLEVENL